MLFVGVGVYMSTAIGAILMIANVVILSATEEEKVPPRVDVLAECVQMPSISASVDDRYSMADLMLVFKMAYQ